MVTILPPGYSLGGQLGQALGQGLQQGVQQAGQIQYQRNLLQNALNKARGVIDDPKTSLTNKYLALMEAGAGIPGSEKYLGPLFEILQRQEGVKTFSETSRPKPSDQTQIAEDSIPQDIKPQDSEPQDSEPQNIVKPPPATKEEFLQRFAETAAPAGLEKALEEEKPMPLNLPKISYAPNEIGFFRRALTAEEKQNYVAQRKAQGANEQTIDYELKLADESDTNKLAKFLGEQGITGRDQDFFINAANTNFPNVKSAEEAFRRTLPFYMQYKNVFGQVRELYKPSTTQSFLELAANTGVGLPALLAGPAGVVANFIYDKLKVGKDKETAFLKYLTGKTSYQQFLKSVSDIARPTVGTPYEPLMRQEVAILLNGLDPNEKVPEITTTSHDIETVFNPLTKKALAKTRAFIPKNLSKMSDEEQINAVSDYLTKHADIDDSLVLLRQEFVEKGADWRNFYEGFKKSLNQGKKPYQLGAINSRNIATLNNPPRDTLSGIWRTGEFGPVVRGQK